MSIKFNILLTGPGNSGKTTWLKRMFKGEYTREHVPSTHMNKFITEVYANNKCYRLTFYETNTMSIPTGIDCVIFMNLLLK